MNFLKKIELFFALLVYNLVHPVQDKINNKSVAINFQGIVVNEMLFSFS